MMKRLMPLIVVGIMLMNVGAVGALGNFLTATKTDQDKYTLNPGDPIVADITLEKTEIPPDTALLAFYTDLASPDIKITIDDMEPLRHGEQEFVIDLAEYSQLENIRTIKIRITGDAPGVATFTTVKILEMTAKVTYTGDDAPREQPAGKMTVRVTTEEITAAKDEINQAWDLFAEVSRKITSLEDQGVDVASLKARLEDERGRLNTAEKLFDQGDQELALDNAESSATALNILKSEAAGLDTTAVGQSDIQRYLVIAAAVIVVFVVLLILKSKREELG